MNKIAIVGNPAKEDIDALDSFFNEEDLKDVCSVAIYCNTEKSDAQLLEEAMNDYGEGHIQGIVCLPLTCSVQSEILKHTEVEKFDLLTVHVNTLARLFSVRETRSDATLSVEDITARVTNFAKSLKRDLGIQNPRICTLAINKEFTETSEEMTLIAPAMNELVKNGIQVFGPLPYQGFFERKDIEAFDGVVELYSYAVDQKTPNSLEELQKNCCEKTVAMITGCDVPVVVTQPESMMTAIGMVLDMIRNRYHYDLPFRHPLPKLYHERKEDGDKARFAKVKKGFNPAEHRRENVTYTTIRQPKTTSETAPTTPNKPAGTE